jgi:signal transduction histidine kinase
MMEEYSPQVYKALQDLMVGKNAPEKAYWSFADFSGGSLLMVTYEPAADDSRSLLRRCAKVFDLAYRRFLDLKEAEEAEREARIEIALERVRSRSMAMQTSDELMDVAQVLFQQLIGLGMDPAVFETCGFVIFRPGTRIGDTFLTQLDGSPLAYTFSAEYGGDRATQEHYASWEKGEPMTMVHLQGQELPEHLDYLTEMSGEPINRFHEMAGVDVPPGSYNYSANFKHGYVAVITTVPMEEAETLYPRFARVFEQAYTRFLDLKKAEAQARESQIEAALERVRSKAMGMRNSDELLEVVATIHQQFSGLGLECGVFWHAHYHPDHYVKALTSEDGSKVTTLMILPRDFSAVPELAVWERGTEPFAVFQFNADQGARYMEHMINKGHFLEVDPHGTGPDDVRANGGLTFVQARTSSGEIGYSLWGEAEPEEESIEVLLRFARVFDLAYRRYQDLGEAEEAEREARIEASLERVRSQAMAMQKPEDISDVSIRMFEELEDLGIDSLRSGISIPDSDERYIFHAATKDEAGNTSLVLGDESVNVHPVIRRAYDGWKEQEAHQIAILEDEDLAEYYHAVFDTMPLPDWKERMKQGQGAKECFATFPFQDGWLYTFTREEMGSAEIELHARFARVFGLAYQRYHDLKKAEAQARESRIEAALERVRGRAMAMQKPDDIGVTCHAMFEEIRTLCPDIIRLGLGVVINENTVQPWLVGKDAEGNPRIYTGRNVVEGEREEIDQVLHAWRKEQSYWFLESSDFLNWAKGLYADAVNEGVILIDIEWDQYFSAFTHRTGFIHVIAREPYDDDHETGRIVNRFAGVFDLAYKRYNDLKQAEMDYAALLEEKARTEKALSDLQSTQKQLVEQEKLASLGSLTAGIAHEIKNPLNFVNNFAEVSVEMAEELRDAIKADRIEEAIEIIGELMENATQIAKHGKRADSIVRSMMQHARGGASDMETIHVNDFLEEYANLAWHGMRARDHGFQAEVKRDFDPEAGSLQVMPQELGRVVLNLLNNAFDAVKTQDDGFVTIASRRTDDAITIEVSDNGPGIPEAIRQKIFEPFFTTKATGEGTGLGLSLSYDIVTKGHNGTMTVGTSDDDGALFTITIPATS